MIFGKTEVNVILIFLKMLEQNTEKKEPRDHSLRRHEIGMFSKYYKQILQSQRGNIPGLCNRIFSALSNCRKVKKYNVCKNNYFDLNYQ